MRLSIGNLEYVTLRLLRRFMLPRALHHWGRFVPYYRTNVSETQPDDTCRLYVEWLSQAGRRVAGSRIIEIGCGTTNGAGYAMVCAGAAKVWCVEPYVAFDPGRDAALLDELAQLHHLDPAYIAARVERSDSFRSVGAGGADVIVSHSVLEHVIDLPPLLSEFRKVLSEHGVMLHVVDYRDHFFKYPLHFLQFSDSVWKRFLDPGDLPRWRLSEHQMALANAGFTVRVLHLEENRDELERIRPLISPDFDLTDTSLGVTMAVLYCEQKDSISSPPLTT